MKDNAIRGAIVGFVFATLYAAYVVALYLFRGSEPFREIRVSLGALVLSYYGGFLAAGAVVGSMIGFVRGRLSAAFAGIVGAFLVLVAVVSALEGPIPTWSGDEWESCVVLSLLFGVPISQIIWRPRNKQPL